MSIISIWQIMLLLYLVSILYLIKIAIFDMKINIATAIHCDVLFHGGILPHRGSNLPEKSVYTLKYDIISLYIVPTPCDYSDMKYEQD